MARVTEGAFLKKCLFIASVSVLGAVQFLGVSALAQQPEAENHDLSCAEPGFLARVLSGQFVTAERACFIQSERDLMRDQVAKQVEEIQLLNEENSMLRAQSEELAARVAAIGVSASEASETALASSVEFETCSLQRDRLVTENAQLIADRDALLAQKDDSSARETESQAKAASMRAEILALQAEASDNGAALSTEIDSLRRQLETCQTAKAALSAQADSLQGEVRGLQVQLRTLQETADGSAALSLQNTALRAEIGGLTAQLDALRVINEADGVLISSQAAELEQLRAQVAAAMQTEQRATAQQLELETARSDLVDALAAKDGLEVTINRMTQELDQALVLAAEAENQGALKSQLVAKSVEIERLEQALDAANAASNANAVRAVGVGLRQVIIEWNAAQVVDDASMRGNRLVVPLAALFRGGSTSLQGGADQVLDALADKIVQLIDESDEQTSENMRFLIVGHADKKPINSSRYPSNWELSAHRAAAITRALVDRGVDPARLLAAGQAEFAPIDQGEDRAALARNRRIEIFSY